MPLRRCVHEAQLKMYEPFKLVPQFQCDARGVPKAGSFTPLGKKYVQRWQEAATGSAIDYRELFDFLFGRIRFRFTGISIWISIPEVLAWDRAGICV